MSLPPGSPTPLPLSPTHLPLPPQLLPQTERDRKPCSPSVSAVGATTQTQAATSRSLKSYPVWRPTDNTLTTPIPSTHTQDPVHTLAQDPDSNNTPALATRLTPWLPPQACPPPEPQEVGEHKRTVTASRATPAIQPTVMEMEVEMLARCPLRQRSPTGEAKCLPHHPANTYRALPATATTSAPGVTQPSIWLRAKSSRSGKIQAS